MMALIIKSLTTAAQIFNKILTPSLPADVCPKVSELKLMDTDVVFLHLITNIKDRCACTVKVLKESWKHRFRLSFFMFLMFFNIYEDSYSLCRKRLPNLAEPCKIVSLQEASSQHADDVRRCTAVRLDDVLLVELTSHKSNANTRKDCFIFDTLNTSCIRYKSGQYKHSKKLL